MLKISQKLYKYSPSGALLQYEVVEIIEQTRRTQTLEIIETIYKIQCQERGEKSYNIYIKEFENKGYESVNFEEDEDYHTNIHCTYVNIPYYELYQTSEALARKYRYENILLGMENDLKRLLKRVEEKKEEVETWKIKVKENEKELKKEMTKNGKH